MAAPKKNPIVREIEQAFKDYRDDTTTIPVVRNEQDVAAYAKAIKQHAARIEADSYGYDSLLLEQVYSTLSADADIARDAAVRVAAIAIAIATALTRAAPAAPTPAQPKAPVAPPVEPTPPSFDDDQDDEDNE